ncbi:MAG: signal recognition particle subunit SRP54 [Alphaproteobacteria bacterium]|jgi:signal recognition particle subunit SRP54
MFDNLTDKLSGVLSKFGKRKTLREDDVASVLREIRLALLDADVSLPVVKQLVDDIHEKAVGITLIKDVEPAQQVVKIVNDALVEILSGGTNQDDEAILDINRPTLSVVMTVGLQGSGKTTSAGKLAKRLTERHQKKVFLASLDNRRPAAQEQLKILGDSIQVASLDIIAGQSALDIADRAIEAAKAGEYDVVILDTAGRTTVDNALMQELQEVKKRTSPHEILLVADSLTGQDAVTTAQAFHEQVGVTGIILTRIDGDGRGGAALSMRHITGRPIKFMGTGETIDAFEEFHPERIASRILGMGDIVSLVEKAAENISEADALSMMEKLKQGIFDYDDLLSQMQQMKNLGGMGGVMGLLPGMRQLKKQLESSNLDDNALNKQKAIVQSMTKKERANPQLVMNASRKRRIAKGAGVTVQDVNKLTQMQKQMAGMMGQMQKMQTGGGGKMGKVMRSLFGSGTPSEEEMQKMAESVKMGGGLPGMGMSPTGGFRMPGTQKKSNKPKKIRLR